MYKAVVELKLDSKLRQTFSEPNMTISVHFCFFPKLCVFFLSPARPEHVAHLALSEKCWPGANALFTGGVLYGPSSSKSEDVYKLYLTENNKL